MELSNVSVAVLAGGLGTRLRPVVADRPKVLAQIRSQPFLSYLLDQIAAAGCRSVVLCTGYLGEQIESTFGKNYGPLRLIYSREQEPLGTAGALKLAITRFESDPVLVMNGDSFCAIDIKAYWNWHCQCQATASMALTESRAAKDLVALDLMLTPKSNLLKRRKLMVRLGSMLESVF